MQHSIVILYNSFSGEGKGRIVARRLAELLHKWNITYALYENEWPTDLASFTRIWLVGGDGTMNYFLNAYDSIPAPLSLFAGGTGNDMHWKLYGPINHEQQASKVLTDPIRKIDVGIVNNQRFVNMIGLGFDGEVLKSVQTARWIGGHLGYLFIVLKKIFVYAECTYTIQINGGEEEKRRCLLFLVANSERTGGGFYVSPKSDIQDGMLNLITAGPLSWFKRLLLLIKVEKGKHLTHPAVRHQLIRNLKIESDTEVFYQLDGELKSAQKFEVAVNAGWLEVI